MNTKFPSNSYLMIERTYLNFSQCEYEFLKNQENNFVQVKLVGNWINQLLKNETYDLPPSHHHRKQIEYLIGVIKNEFNSQLFIYRDTDRGLYNFLSKN